MTKRREVKGRKRRKSIWKRRGNEGKVRRREEKESERMRMRDEEKGRGREGKGQGICEGRGES